MFRSNSKQVEEKVEIAAEFSKNGFVHLKNVFSEEHCEKFRTQILDKFNELKALYSRHGGRRLTQTQAFSIPGLCEPLVNKKVVQALKGILENEYTMIPNFTVHKNYFSVSQSTIAKIPIPNRYGWHIDAGGEAVIPDHLNPDYRVIKCGLYLQENAEFGGGIDVVPGSHRLLLKTGLNRLDRKSRDIKSKLGIIFNNKTVPIKKGDVVIFDSFLMHSATQPKGIFEKITEHDKKKNHYPSMPPEKTKITLYFDACRSRFAPSFLRDSVQRAKQQLNSATSNETSENLSFCDPIRFFFEQGFPKEFLERAQEQKIQVGRLEGSDLEEARRVYQSYKDL